MAIKKKAIQKEEEFKDDVVAQIVEKFEKVELSEKEKRKIKYKALSKKWGYEK